MLKLTALAVGVFSAAILAQCNPGTLVGANIGGNQGNEGGTVFFDLTVNSTITITDINFRAGNTNAHPAGSTNQGFIEVWLGPSTWLGNATNPSAWTLVDQSVIGTITHNATATNPGVLSNGVLTTGITLSPGSYGVALHSQAATWNHNYSNPGAANPVSTPELTLTAGGASNGLFTSPIFQTRIWNGEIVYTCGGNPNTIAASEAYGDGCYALNTSYGEIIGNPSTSLDIAGQTHTLTFSGNSYVVSGTATNTFVAPGPNAVVLPLVQSDDVASVVTALGGPLPFPIVYPRGGSVGIADDLEVCSSGFITPIDVAGSGTTAPAPGAQPGDATPDLGEFFGSGLERWVPLWQSMAPSNNVTVEVVSNTLVITWNAVAVSGNTGTNSFQFVIDGTGNVEYRYDASTNGVGGGSVPVVMGLTQGNGSLENEIDVSVDVLAGFSTDPFDNTPLDLQLDARPLLGTNPNYVISGYDAPTTTLGTIALDFIQHNPGLPLASFGMPGCFQYTNPTATIPFVTGGASQVVMPFIQGGIPTSPIFNGVTFYGQSVTLTGSCAGSPCNTLGVITSNGLRIFLGTQ